MPSSESNRADQKINESTILLCQISGRLFGLQAGHIRIITEFSITDSRVILESNIGSIKLSDSKIPLFNISDFLELNSITSPQKFSAIIVTFDGKSFYALLAEKILGVINVETFYSIPRNGLKYQNIYKSLFYLEEKLILLVDLEQIFSKIVNKERLLGHL